MAPKFHPYRQTSGRRLHPLAIVLIVIAATVLVAVIVGNLLNVFLDDETYRRYTSGEKEPEVTERADVYLPKVDLSAFSLGGPVDTLTGKPAVSVLLALPDGTLTYTSPVSEREGFAGNSLLSLSDAIGQLSAKTSYISGIFYPQAFSLASTPDLFFSAATSECALLREFTRAGGSEVLLSGVPLKAESLDDVMFYLRSLRSAVGDAAIGVSVSLSVAEGADGWELIGNLLTVADFCALDLRGISGDRSASEILLASDYFLRQYGMRLLLSTEQTELIAAAEERNVPRLQIAEVPVLPEPVPTPDPGDELG